uniref:Uncharacterized protein n=1 Tax=Cacopsylla melanoneura TaxID=428564 RepID=A0A8D8Q6H0_9HEMI
MATAATFTTLGALHDLPSNDATLDRLKELARSSLPDGWRDWTLINSIDLDFAVDPVTLNKVRFALPTDGVARAFDPSASGLKEHRFKEIKIRMLSWAFCRGLVFSPSNLSKQIRGSSTSHERMVAAISPLRSNILSREAADSLLSAGSAGTPSRRSSTASEAPPRHDSLEARLVSQESRLATQESRFEAQEARFVAQETRNQNLQNALDGILRALQSRTQMDQETTQALPPAPSLSPSYVSESDAGSEPGDWEAPSMLVESADEVFDTDMSFNLETSTKEMEPSIPLPSPDIEAKGMQCQRLNSKGWDKIPYAEAQKEIQAGGVFSRLKVNPEIEGRSSSEAQALSNMDATLGVITHGLLLQRKLLEEAMRDAFQKIPAAAPVLRESLAAKSASFRKTSDNLLQYVCGKRSDIFLKRRKALETLTRVNPKYLKDIPPAEGFLFDPKLLPDAMKNHKAFRHSVAPQKASRKYFPSATVVQPSPSVSRKRPSETRAPQPPKKRIINAPGGKFPKSSGFPQRRH